MPSTEEEARPRRLRQVLRILVSVVLAGAIFAYVLGSAADFSEVRRAISSMTGVELATLGLAAIWNLVTYWMVIVPRPRVSPTPRPPCWWSRPPQWPMRFQGAAPSPSA